MSDKMLSLMFPNDINHVQGLNLILEKTILPKSRLLDLGCGTNTALARFRSIDCEVWGSDFDFHSSLQHPEWFKKLEVTGKIPFCDNSFDLVVAIMVLEHVDQPSFFMREIARVLRPGGRFIAHSISGIHYVTWIRRLVSLAPHHFSQWLVNKLYGRKEEDTFPTLYRLNTLKQLNRESLRAGFEKLTITRYPDPGYFRFLTPIQISAILIDWILEKLYPSLGKLYFTAEFTKSSAAEIQEAA